VVFIYARANARVALLLALASLSLGVGIAAGLTSYQPVTTEAATVSTMNFQARLMNAAGAIVPDGNYNVEFKLYNVSSGGTAQWTEDYLNSASQGVQVKNGYVTVNLGSITGFPSINWDQQEWLTMNIGGTTVGVPTYDGEMNPRLALTAIPYAFKAGQLAQYNNTTGFTSTLSLVQPTGGNQLFQVPDQGAAGTYNLLTTNQANTNYIQNTTTLQTANFAIQSTASGNIGALIKGAASQTGDLLQLQNSSSAVLARFSSIGNLYVTPASNQTGIIGIQSTGGAGSELDLGWGGTYGASVGYNRAIGGALEFTVGGTTFGTPQASGKTVLTLGGNGAALFQNNADSTTAFQVQNSSGAQLFAADTSNSKVEVTGNLNTPFGGFGRSQNLFLYSEQLDQSSYWVPSNITVGANNAVAPNGTTTAETLTASSTGNSIGQVVTVSASTTYTMSWWVKLGTLTAPGYAVYDFTHSAYIVSPTTYTEATSTGWVRVSRTFTTPSGTTSVGLYPQFISSSTGTMYIWGAQVEQSSTAGTYIQTAGSTVATVVNGATVNGQLQLQVTSASSIGQIIKGAASQSGDLLQLQNSSGTVLSKFDSGGNLTLGSGSGVAAAALIVSVASNNNGIQIANASVPGRSWDLYPFTNGSNTDLRFYEFGSTSTDRLTLQSGGNVGIGTTGPNYKLDVQGGDINTSGVIRTGTTQRLDASGNLSNIGTINGNTFTSTALTFSGAGATTIQAATGQTLTVQSQGAGVLTLDTGAGAALNVGNTNATSIIVGNTNTATLTFNAASSGTINFGTNTAGKTINIGAIGSTSATTSVLVATTTGLAQTVQIGGNGASGGSHASTTVALQGGATMFKVANAGAIVQTFTNSTTAFQIQNASAAPVFVVDTTTTNLITNPGFEVNTTGWAGTGTGVTATQNLTLTKVYFGYSSLKVLTASSGTTTATVTGFTGTITAGTYNFSFYAMGDSAITLGSTVTFTGGAGTCTLNSTAVVTTGFNRYSCSITTSGTTTGISFTTATTSANLYIDSVQLTTTTNLVPYRIGGIQLRGVITNAAAFQSTSDSTSAFQIQNAAGTANLFVADTLNGRIGIGTAAPGFVLDVNGATNVTGALTTSSTINTNTFTSTAATLSGANPVISAGTANTSITLNANGTGQINIGDTVSAKTIQVGSVTNSSATTLKLATNSSATQLITIGGSGVTSGSGAASIVTMQGGATMLKVANAGTTVQTFTNSATAFQVQNTSAASIFTVDTTTSAGKVIIGTGSTGTTTPSILVLDNNTSNTEPTGVNGAMYYNSVMSEMRCYVAGGWSNCSGMGPEYQETKDDFMGQCFGQNNWSGLGDSNWTSYYNTAGPQAFISQGTGVANHPGTCALSTTTGTTGTASMIQKWPQAYNDINRMIFVFQLSNVTNDTVRLGISDQAGVATAQPLNGIYLQLKTATSAAFQAITRKAGAETAIGTGVTAVSGTWYQLEIRQNAANNWEFYLNGTLVATETTTATFPTALLNAAPTVQVITGDTTQHDVVMDYWYESSRRLVRY
jgi:hypothetical protein